MRNQIIPVECNDDNLKDIKDDIKFTKKCIIDENNKQDEIMKQIESNRAFHSKIIVPIKIKDKIIDLFKNDDNYNDLEMNGLLFELIQMNLDIFKKIHEEEIKLMDLKYEIETNIQDFENKLKKNIDRMTQYNVASPVPEGPNMSK